MRMSLVKTIAVKGARRKPVFAEHGMQVALFKWAALAARTCPALGLMFAIPNGGGRPSVQVAGGKRVNFEVIRLKAEGMKPGVPDICLPVACGGYHGLWLELKAGKNTTSPEQKEWLAGLSGQGMAVFVVWDSWTAAMEVVEWYLAGAKERAWAEGVERWVGKTGGVK